VLAEEIARPQPFEIDLDVETRLLDAGASDDLVQTIDYGPVVETVCKLAESSHYALLESLASAIADAVLADPRVDAVMVAVRKLRPPLAADVATVGVRISRRRGEPSSAER
jgi:7,8-dihydroneopterin aldolase/epimerase/oxygenase